MTGLGQRPNPDNPPGPAPFSAASRPAVQGRRRRLKRPHFPELSYDAPRELLHFAGPKPPQTHPSTLAANIAADNSRDQFQQIKSRPFHSTKSINCETTVYVVLPSAWTPGHEPKMRSHGAMKDEEAIDAAKEATRGAVYGAVKWGAFAGILGGIGYLTSPLYRGLTIQFKVYIQMSGMAFGSMVEADNRIRQYEAHVRMQRRIARDRAMWQRFEDEYGKDDDE